MLHIILLILKILGLLIVGILGVIVLATSVILFASGRYRLQASGKDTSESVRGTVQFQWLLHLLSGELKYEKGSFTWHIRVGWKKFGSDLKKERTPDNNSQMPELSRKPAKQQSSKLNEVTNSGKADLNPDSDPANARTDHGKMENKAETEKVKQKHSICERLEAFWEKIKYTFRKICDNIRSLRRKKEHLTAFVQDETHKSAFFKIVRELRRFLKKIRPRKAEVYAEFGFTDPAVTGYVLALISMFYPFVGEYTEIRPDFEHRVLRGRIYVDGRIRAVQILSVALHLLLDKNVRTTYRHIRKQNSLI